LQGVGKENKAGGKNALEPGQVAAGLPGRAGTKVGSYDEGEREEEGTAPSRWALHCHATLGAVSASSVLKASS
jgi:hypothetical protein